MIKFITCKSIIELSLYLLLVTLQKIQFKLDLSEISKHLDAVYDLNSNYHHQCIQCNPPKRNYDQDLKSKGRSQQTGNSYT